MLQSNPPIPNGAATNSSMPLSNTENQALVAPILLQYWQIALRWKWVITGIIGFFLILGFIVTLLMTPEYTATSRIEISREQKNITNVDGLESRDAGRDLEFYQTQYSLLEARTLAERVSRQLRLAANNEFFAASGIEIDGGGLFTQKKGVSNAERARREKIVVDTLLANVSINPIRGSALIDINYTCASPHLSAQISNAWTQQFIEASMDRRFASTADARKFLEGRLADLRARLEQSERDVVNYASD